MTSFNRSNQTLNRLTKESLTQAVLLLMDDKPYSEIRVTDICRRAGVSRNAFYRNYSAKDAILRRYLFEITDDFRHRLRQMTPLTHKQHMHAICTHLASMKPLTKKLLSANLAYLITDIFFKSFIDFSKSDEYPIYARCHLAGSIVSIFIHWIANDQPETPEEMASIICKLHHFDEDALVLLPSVSNIDSLMENFIYNQ